MDKFFRLLGFVVLSILFPITSLHASNDKISEKFSLNQKQFEKAISHFSFKFSDEAIAKLKDDLSRMSEVMQIRKQIREAKVHLRSLRANLAGQNTVKKPSFMSVDVSALRLFWLEPLSESERTDSEGFILPSIKEWFLDRQRDWMVLGAEVMTAYDDFSKSGTLSPESFSKLIEKSIENIVFRGQFVWFDMEIPKLIIGNIVGKYDEYRKSFQNQTIDRDKYLSELKEQVFFILFEGQGNSYTGFIEEFDYGKFSVRTYNRYKPGEKQEDLRITRFQTGQNYFPLLREDFMLALFDIESRKEVIERSMKRLENLRKKGFSLIFSEEGSVRSNFENVKPHILKVPIEPYKAIERIFDNCYVSKAFEDARELNASFNNLKVFPEDPPLKSKKEATLPVFASKSYSFAHPDSYCQIIGSVFRYIYLENELELYRKYIVESGDFYDRVIELREGAESLSERLKEVKNQLSELERTYQEELDKDKGFFGKKVFFWKTNSDRLRFIQSQIDKQNERIKFIETKKAGADKSWELYKPYHYLGWVFKLEKLRAEKKALLDQLKEETDRLTALEEASTAPRMWVTSFSPLKGMGSLVTDTKERIHFITQEIREKEDQISSSSDRHSWKWRAAKRHIKTLENLLPRFQREYEEAKDSLVSLSLEEDYKKIQTEWVRVATVFFHWLKQQHLQYQEHEKAVAIKQDLPPFIRKVRGHLAELQSRLTNLEEEKISVSLSGKRHLELKLKIISELKNKRQPRLEDIFHAFLLEHSGESNPDFYDKFLSALHNVSETEEPVSVDSFKEVYETKISNTYHEGNPLRYNRRAFRLTQPIFENRVQCYSGSLLFHILTELAGLTKTPRFALFTEGHVLPGILNDNGNELWGIESTAEGDGLVNFGSVSKIAGKIRIMEMYPFLLIELLKSEISNFPELYAESQDALKKYGFSVEKLHPLDQERIHPVKKDTESYDVLNATPFGFGSVNVPLGDRKREKITEESLSFYGVKRGDGPSSDDPNREGDSLFDDLSGGGALFPPVNLPDFLGEPVEQSHLSEEEQLMIRDILLDMPHIFYGSIKRLKDEEVICTILAGVCLDKIKSKNAEEYSSCWNAVENQAHQLYREGLIIPSLHIRIMECVDSKYHHDVEFVLSFFFTRDWVFKLREDTFNQ